MSRIGQGAVETAVNEVQFAANYWFSKWVYDCNKKADDKNGLPNLKFTYQLGN